MTELRLLLNHYRLACEEFRDRHVPDGVGEHRRDDPDSCF
jgi:hypothetical protein